MTVRSLFYQNTSSARKKLKKKKQQQQQKKQGDYFYKEIMANYSSGGGTDLFSTGYNLGTKNRSDKRFSMFYSTWYPLSDKTF